VNSILLQQPDQSTRGREELRSHLAKKFNVIEKQIRLSEHTFRILKVRDTNALLDAITADDFSADERLPYWADIWTSSLALASFCLHETDLQGKHVLELGCGLGLAGIAAAKAGAIVTLSDYERDALDFARYNAFLNLSDEMFSRSTFLHFDWRHLPALRKFDMIIGADIVYERRNFFPLIDALTALLSQDGFAVFTEPGRSIGECFFQMLREESYRLETTSHCVELEGKRSEVRSVRIQLPDRHSIKS
jgi:predicted nicotinamide N-methyase